MSASRRLVRTTSSTATSQNVLNRSTTRRSRSFFARIAKPVATAQSSPATPSKTSKPLTTLQEANPRNLPEVWFNPTYPYANGAPLGQNPNRPPDERKVKLGKSKLYTSLAQELPQSRTKSSTFVTFSSAHPPRTTSHTPTIAAPPRNPRAEHQPAPLPFDAPASTNCLWAGRLHRRAVDITHRMEPPTHHRRR